MGYVLSFLVTALMVALALALIMAVAPLRKFAGLGNVAPTGPAAMVAPKVAG